MAVAVLGACYQWGIETGRVSHNPTRTVRAFKINRRERYLSEKEVACFSEAIADWEREEPRMAVMADAVRLLMLTGQRRDEVGQMTWTEVDLDAKLWTIPKERAKNGQAHDVPLSDQAVAVLSGIKRITGDRQLVFTTTGETPVSGFSKAKRRLDKAMPGAAPWVLHDLRRTMASGMARLGISLPVIEKVLNHTSGSFGGIVGVYQRHTFADEKRIALGLWAQHVQISVYNRSPT